MNATTHGGFNPKQFGAKVAPVLAIAIAGLATRIPLAANYPVTASILFLWIVSDTMVLALMARAPGHRLSRPEILGALAAASLVVGLGSPVALRQAFLTTPVVVGGMVAVVLAHVGWASSRARRVLRLPGQTTKDRWTAAASEIIPPALVRLAVAELTLIHMALFRWGGPADVPDNSCAFTYHKHLAPMCASLLALQVIEIAVYHIFVGHWSRTAALVLFVLSDVGLIYMVGLIKSFRFRPVLVTPEGVRIRAGFLIDRMIPVDMIKSVETGFAGTDVHNPATLNAALLAWPNIVIRLNEPVARHSFLRRRAPFSMIAFRLDEPEPFVRLLKWRLGQNGGS